MYEWRSCGNHCATDDGPYLTGLQIVGSRHVGDFSRGESRPVLAPLKGKKPQLNSFRRFWLGRKPGVLRSKEWT